MLVIDYILNKKHYCVSFFWPQWWTFTWNPYFEIIYWHLHTIQYGNAMIMKIILWHLQNKICLVPLLADFKIRLNCLYPTFFFQVTCVHLPHKPTYATALSIVHLLQAASVTPCLKLQRRDCARQTSPHISATRSIHCQYATSKHIDVRPRNVTPPLRFNPEPTLHFPNVTPSPSAPISEHPRVI